MATKEQNQRYKAKRRQRDIEIWKLKRSAVEGAAHIPDELCEICKQEFGRRLCKDHCHKTGTIRGMLCTTCNSGLGMFKDNPELLAEAIAYLERHRG